MCIYKQPDQDLSIDIKLPFVLQSLSFRDFNGNLNISNIIAYLNQYFNDIEFDLLFNCINDIEYLIKQEKQKINQNKSK